MQVVAVARRETAAFASHLAIQYRRADVTDAAAMRRVFDEFPEASVLVNNAGLSLPTALVRGGDDDACRRVFDVNALAPLAWTRELLRRLETRQAPHGHVLNVSSLAAHRVPSSELGVYAASKAALRALTEATRLDLRTHNLPYRISLVSPGIVHTDFYTHLYGQIKADLIHAAVDSLEIDHVVQACLYILQAPPDCEVHDILLRPTSATL